MALQLCLASMLAFSDPAPRMPVAVAKPSTGARQRGSALASIEPNPAAAVARNTTASFLVIRIIVTPLCWRRVAKPICKRLPVEPGQISHADRMLSTEASRSERNDPVV